MDDFRLRDLLNDAEEHWPISMNLTLFNLLMLMVELPIKRLLPSESSANGPI